MEVRMHSPIDTYSQYEKESESPHNNPTTHHMRDMYDDLIKLPDEFEDLKKRVGQLSEDVLQKESEKEELQNEKKALNRVLEAKQKEINDRELEHKKILKKQIK